MTKEGIRRAWRTALTLPMVIFDFSQLHTEQAAKVIQSLGRYKMTSTSNQQIQRRSLKRDRRTADGDKATLCISVSVPLPPFNVKIKESDTHDVVVLAAHRIRRTRLPAAQADSRDRRAPEPELRRHALEIHPEQGEQRRACGRVRLFGSVRVCQRQLVTEAREKGGSRTHALHAVAALHGPAAAAAGAGVVGGRENREGEGGEDCEAGEHGEVGMRGCVGGGWKGEC